MSDSEHSDGLEELQDLIKEYEEPEVKEEHNEATSAQIVHVKTEKSSAMEKVIFGDKAGLLRNLAVAVGEKVEDDEETEKESTNERRTAKKRKAVWADPDDDQIEVGEIKKDTKRTGPRNHLRKDKPYKDLLTQRFERIVGAEPKWAKFDAKKRDADIDSDDEELLRTVGFLEKPSGAILSSTHLAYKRLKDLNRATMSEGPIVSVQFHPTSTAALVAGEYGYATIYSVDGQKNEKLHSMHFKRFPLKCVRMSQCGTKAYFGSVKPFYYCYDLMTTQETRFMLPRDLGTSANFHLSNCGRYMSVAGRGGELHLFDANANELIHTFKQENNVMSMRFTGDSQRIICNSDSCNVSLFSLRMRRLEHSFIDDGCIKGSAIDLAPNQRMLATSSMEGVVNVYDFESVQTTATPTPLKCFLNLTTAISDVKFNHSSELLAMSSGEVNDAVKLAHFPSATVYSNFPGMKSGLGYVRTLEFSPGSGYLAMGTRNKCAPLYRLKHFNNY